MRTRTRIAATAAAIAALVPSTTPAHAATATAAVCGAVLTTDAYLRSDLTCSGPGLTLKGDVTLNLRGHRLRGSIGTAVTVIGQSAVTITKGRIEGWTIGVVAAPPDVEDQVKSVRISEVTFRDNEVAVDLSSRPGLEVPFTVTRSRFVGNEEGVAGVFTGATRVRRSKFVDNGRAVSVDSGSLTLTRTRLLGNGSAVECQEAGCLLTKNHLTDNDTGISVRTTGATVTGNVLRRNGVGFSGFVALNSDLKRNRFVGNTTGVELTTSGATLTSNVFVKNKTGFTASEEAESFVAALKRNRFLRNRDGIYVTDGGVSLGANRAIANKRYGIYAPGAVDLGGNRARRNGHSPQCVGVVC